MSYLYTFDSDFKLSRLLMALTLSVLVSGLPSFVPDWCLSATSSPLNRIWATESFRCKWLVLMTFINEVILGVDLDNTSAVYPFKYML